MSRNERVKGIVRGRVQGVGFRYFTQKEALRLGLTGEVKNLSDGSVAFVAEGDKKSLEEFLERLQQGPSFSHVSDVQSDWTPASDAYTKFDITY